MFQMEFRTRFQIYNLISFLDNLGGLSRKEVVFRFPDVVSDDNGRFVVFLHLDHTREYWGHGGAGTGMDFHFTGKHWRLAAHNFNLCDYALFFVLAGGRGYYFYFAGHDRRVHDVYHAGNASHHVYFAGRFI